MATTPQWDWHDLRRLSEREARRILGSGSDIDDAVQEALARMWRKRRSCRTPFAPEAWAAQIARREALRQRERTGRHTTREVALDDGRELAGPEPDGEQTIEALDVRQALRHLKTDDRKLISLRYLQDMTQEAAADVLGIPAGTAKVRLHRLRTQLRRSLEP